jgi:hypothetical protein
MAKMTKTQKTPGFWGFPKMDPKSGVLTETPKTAKFDENDENEGFRENREN